MKSYILRYGLALILIFSLTLQTITLGKYSFWFDESYTSVITSESFAKAVESTSVDVHPPLYYIAIHAWGELFGRSDIGLRSFSVVFALLSLIILYLILRRFFTKPISLFGLFVASIAPYTIRYAQEARMYTLASAILLAMTYVLVFQLQRPKEKRSIRLWLLYGALLASAIYTHYFSGLILLSHALYILYSQQDPSDGSIVKNLVYRIKNIDRNYIFSLIFAFLLFIPWLPKLISQFNSVSGGFWIPGVSITSLSTIATYAFGLYENNDRSILNFAVLAVIIASIYVVYKLLNKFSFTQKAGVMLLLGSFALPVLFLLMISLVGTSYFYFRYFTQFSYMFYAAIGVMVALTYQIKRYRYIAIITGVIIVITLSIGTSRVLRGVDKSNVQMNKNFQVINDNFMDSDAIVATEFGKWFDATHYNRTNSPIYYLSQGLDYGSLQPITSKGLEIDSLDTLDGYSRIWIIRPPTEQVMTPFTWGEPMTEAVGADSSIDLYDL